MMAVFRIFLSNAFYGFSGLSRKLHPALPLKLFIIKFPYNARSDWLKECALSENRARVDDGKLAFKFLLRNFDKFDPN